MIELEENIRTIKAAKTKLHELGESLWHKRKTKWINKIRRANDERGILDRKSWQRQNTCQN